jgi:hypothetical protein
VIVASFFGIACAAPSDFSCATDQVCIVATDAGCIALKAVCCENRAYCGQGTLAADAGSCAISSELSAACG